MSPQTLSQQFSLDVNGLTDLKRQVRENSPQGLKAVAQQFEALFLQMVLKSMRDATPHEGMFDSDQSRMYESLLDQQLAQVLSAKGGGVGLAAMIEKQLSRQPQEPGALGDLSLVAPQSAFPLSVRDLALETGVDRSNAATETIAASIDSVGKTQFSSVTPGATTHLVAPTPREFVNRIWPYAYEVSQLTGVPAHFMVAQAALETGWGKSEPRLADGRASFNLFGVKAGKSWTGAMVEATTSEFVNGIEQKQTERFRAYGSYAEAFSDYASLLTANPRYAAVLGNQNAAQFARGLQQAGYATDPMYATKLERIIAGNILRSSLSG